jgi:predicted DCC family thiol-disulfide oxidoreductase YuxK
MIDRPEASQPAADILTQPVPRHRQGADVVIYDGHCRLCTAAVHRLARWDRRGRLEFLALDDPEIARRWPGLDRANLAEEMHVIDSHGRRYRGAAALRILSRRLPRLWLLAPLLHLPGTLPLWQGLYQWLAQRRYLFGRCSHDSESCRLP